MNPIEELRAKGSIDTIAAGFDAASHAQRLEWMYQLTHDDQARLFELATGRACHLDGDFVPSSKPPLTEVIHWGINSLPTFRKFQKRFARSKSTARHAVGYNEQTMKLFTGPGFFTAREDLIESKGPTVVVDYTLLPSEKVESWPPILSNKARLSRFVYNGTMDWMWKVSNNVSVGRASRGGQWMDNWFVLCRQD
jgi:hypothetical protein